MVKFAFLKTNPLFQLAFRKTNERFLCAGGKRFISRFDTVFHRHTRQGVDT